MRLGQQRARPLGGAAQVRCRSRYSHANILAPLQPPRRTTGPSADDGPARSASDILQHLQPSLGWALSSKHDRDVLSGHAAALVPGAP